MKQKAQFIPFFQRHAALLIAALLLFMLSFLADAYWLGSSKLSAISDRTAAYLHKNEKNYQRLNSDSLLVNNAIAGKLNLDDVERLMAEKYFVYFYASGKVDTPILKFWNTRYILPEVNILQDKRSAGFQRMANGYYVWLKTLYPKGMSIALIPVQWNFIISNDYLYNNLAVLESEQQVLFDVIAGKGARANIALLSGENLFHIVEKPAIYFSENTVFSIVCRLLAIGLLLFLLHKGVSQWVATRGLLIGLTGLVTVLLLLRMIMYFFSFPLNLRQFELFDPAVYGTNAILKSLGDLLVNVLLALWIILFLRYHVYRKKIVLPEPRPFYKWVYGMLGVIIILAATYTSTFILQSLVADSQISFDVVNFFSLNGFTVIGFLILSCIATTYYFLCHVVFYLLKPFFQHQVYVLFLMFLITGLFYLSFKIGEISGGFQLYVLLWLVVFLMLLQSDKFYLIASKLITSRIVFWIFFFSASIAIIIIRENNIKELRNRQHYAEILAIKSNPASETLLNSMLTDFKLDYLADNFFRFKDSVANYAFKDSLVKNNFSSYTNKYDTKIFTYDGNEAPLFNQERMTYNVINAILVTQAKPTALDGLFYYDVSFDKFGYLTKKTITDKFGTVQGYVFVQVNPRSSKNETLSPELFSKGQYNTIYNSSTFAFAIYNNNKLVESHNDYAFAALISPTFFAGKQYLLINKKGTTELWYNAGAGKAVVIAKQNDLGIETITLFSYLFCSFLLITAFVWLTNVLLRTNANTVRLREYFRLNIRNQIHGTIIFFSVISFVVIGAATIVFFIGRYESNNREKLSRTIQIMKAELLRANASYFLDKEAMLSNKPTGPSDLDDVIKRVSDIHGVDVNVYSVDGNLKASSLPLPYVKGIVSTKMEPLALYHLTRLKEIQFFQKEKIGKLNYLSSYVPILDKDGKASAFLNVPYFTSQSRLRDEISNFLITIINLNAFIFLIAGIVALFITNRITNSFSIIGEKMKEVNIGKGNEAISWKGTDEIGTLVKEFNTMMAKLDASAAELARSEREDAWKEMARQVAHEIKNPLTPMKLSMQFLQKSIEADAPNIKALSASVAQTLVEQIDHLNMIAGEFSQFANIAQSSMERINIADILNSLRILYISNKSIQCNWAPAEEGLFMIGDKTHCNRLFTNLVQNALEAVPSGVQAILTVNSKLEGDTIKITIKDNGVGIPDHIQTKIFTPNFTTKSSGTGLGLAMCKRIVEQANGSITFETSNDGTTFYLSFPAVA